MFRTLVELIPKPTPPTPDPPPVDKANAVLAVHPLQLSRWLEEVWSQGGVTSDLWKPVINPGVAVVLGDAEAVTKTRLPQKLLDTFFSGVRPTPGNPAPVQDYVTPPPALGIVGTGGVGQPPIWEHLLYAYLVESTGLFEILGEVVRRYGVGETLPAPTMNTMVWVRSTEELFFRDQPLFSSGGLMTSQLRPNARINRRNAYWRLFGLDLPHDAGKDISGQPWKLDVGPMNNTRFLELWTELLRQVWMGIENDRNQVGANPTDANYIGYLCQTLGEMMQLRRRGGMLSREEFAYVTMLSWFHLTVEHDTAVVLDLSANAGPQGNAADRLAAIGARVGIAPSRQARELFELADLVSPLMWAIELGLFNAAGQAEMLFRSHNLPSTVTPIIAQTMNRIVDLWQSATGDRVKDLAVTQRRPQTSVRAAQPTKLLPGGSVPAAPARSGAPAWSPAPAPAPVPSMNGHAVSAGR